MKDQHDGIGPLKKEIEEITGKVPTLHTEFSLALDYSPNELNEDHFMTLEDLGYECYIISIHNKIIVSL